MPVDVEAVQQCQGSLATTFAYDSFHYVLLFIVHFRGHEMCIRHVYSILRCNTTTSQKKIATMYTVTALTMDTSIDTAMLSLDISSVRLSYGLSSCIAEIPRSLMQFRVSIYKIIR